MPHQKSDKTTGFIIFVFAIFLVANFIFTQYEVAQLKNEISSVSPLATPLASDSCGEACRAYINSAIEGLTGATVGPTPTATPVPVATKTPVPQSTGLRITYIPLTGGSTQNTDWTTITGSQFTLNIGDYGANAYATWDANLRVDNANGTTYARLYDKTHNIAVNGSEISLTNNSTATDVTSGALQFWSGNNNYVVQVKSLNSFWAFVDSGRVKINY